MKDTEIKFGQRVRDDISGFEGIVVRIGDHISGCTRFGVYPSDVGATNRGSEEFFYEDQLTVVDEETEFTDKGANARTEAEVELGQLVSDDVSSFEGIVSVINYSIWNCPKALLVETDGEKENMWVDDVRLDVITDSPVHTYNDPATAETGAVADKAPSNEKA